MNSQKETDEIYMRRCIRLAMNGRQNARPNPMVGAVITVPSGLGRSIIGEGYHVRWGEGHAEVNAFASVSASDEPRLKEATVYVSLEPCAHYGKTPPCCDLMISKGVRRVVVGCVDPFSEVQGRGIQRMRDAGIEVTVGVLEEECRWLNRRFFTFHEQRRPYIILKWAQTADGFLDDHCRPVQISTAFTKMLSHRLRATEDAIVVGRVTDEREHPQLNVRDWSGQHPVRFVLSSRGRSSAAVSPLAALLEECRERQLQSLIVEGGAKTHESFLSAGLWDEIRVETGTMVVGSGTKAPLLPAGIREISHEKYDGNSLVRYVKDRR